MSALLLALLAVAAPDGTAARRVEEVACFWMDLGQPRVEAAARPPSLYAGQGFGWWGIRARGRVRLDVRDRHGWWLGKWVSDVTHTVRVEPNGGHTRVPLQDDSEEWRSYGMELAPWLIGEVLLCAWGRAYLWGPELRAWGTPHTSHPFAWVEEPPRFRVSCVSSDPERCK